MSERRKKIEEKKRASPSATTMAARGATLDSFLLNRSRVSLSVLPSVKFIPSAQQQQATRSLSTASASASKELSFDVS